MGSIRKKTSNRLKIHDRERLKKKVKDNKKKQAKKAKKVVQWKSKNKDPGIPNEFPYKDQILAEVAETRRLDAEEKARKAEERKLARMKAKGIEPTSEADAAEAAEDAANDDTSGKPTTKKDLNVGAEAIAGLGAKILTGDLKKRPKPMVEEAMAEDDDEDDGEPALVNRDLKTLKSVLDEADVVLEIVDARDPLEFRCAEIEGLAKQGGKKFAVILNKIDLCPREAVAAWVAHLRPLYPTFVFKSASAYLSTYPTPTPSPSAKGKSKVPTGDAQGAEALLGFLAHLAKGKKGDAPLCVAVTGVANVGKSSLVNSILKRSVMPVYDLTTTSRGATTTELPQEINFTLEANGKAVRVIDTPGLAFVYDHEAEHKDLIRGRDILLRSRGRIDKLKDPSPPISYLVSRANNEDLMLLYNLAAFAKNDPTAFLSGVARSNQLIKKKGDLDIVTASRIVLRDWSVGKFAHYAMPPKPSPPSLSAPSSSSSSSAAANLSTSSERVSAGRRAKKEVPPPKWLAALYALDDALVETLKVRKELRKEVGVHGGFVRMAGGEVDGRGVKSEEEWVALSQEKEGGEDKDSEDEDEEMDGEGEAEFIGEEDVEEEVVFDEDEEVVDSDDEEEEEVVEEEEEVVVPEPKKRKRGAAGADKPSKKVAFGGKKGKSRTAEPGDAPSTKTTSILKVSKTKSAEERPVKKQKKAAVVVKKVANVAGVGKKAKENATAGKEGDAEAYNFGAFF